MKNILIIDEGAQDMERSTTLALLLAGTVNVKLYVLNTSETYTNLHEPEMSSAGPDKISPGRRIAKNNRVQQLRLKYNSRTGLNPGVAFIDDIDFVSENAVTVVKKFNIGLLVKGLPKNTGEQQVIESNFLTWSARSGCPVLLVPEQFPYKKFEKIVYATDLRYCRQDVIGFLSKFAVAFNASVLVANIAAKGLPFMEDNYALDVFNDTVVNRANHDHFYFNNIRERNIPKAIDILVNDMAMNLLVMVNHRYHFNESFGSTVPYVLPAYIAVPVLIFPC